MDSGGTGYESNGYVLNISGSDGDQSCALLNTIWTEYKWLRWGPVVCPFEHDMD